MTDWLILIDQPRDLSQGDTPHKVMTVREYLARPQLFDGRRPGVINLSRSYAYQSSGYYAALLAEARGHRTLPTVQTMLELSRKALYKAALPDLEESLNEGVGKLDAPPAEPFKLLVVFGQAEVAGYARFARLLFDWFRCPVIEVAVQPGAWWRIDRLRPLAPSRLNAEQRAFMFEQLGRYTTRAWRGPKARVPARWSLAVLHNPRDAMPPTKVASLERLAHVGARMGIEVEPIQKGDFARLAEFDALFIRETTNIDNHTYRFARRAEQEGMPVIDDTQSMIRCTNKVYLKEVLEAAGLPMPDSLVLATPADLARAEERLGFPLVLKVPDGSFSRGVHKIESRAALAERARALFADTDLLLAQTFMPTTFDWRVGVLGGEPLFASQYLMAKNHWQIINHRADGKVIEGGFKTFAVEDAPAEVIDIAVRATRPIGNGLYGVDLKQNEQGVFIIEINDNPNLDTAIEGAVLKDALWRRLLEWFLARLERR
ncbi:RimK family protein [Roseospira marina]|uniref:RimK family protein n=1 Tax=Roseospira marina TaxID=140057 RepID=A0A5M6IAM0_9PROT|nr:RimK family protein [Roseospira marina]KAA5605253.1 RimK family protein [Roseospira marina]MBB4314712.1 glutathione synthase/RimK-type ligase-like ATP-grasp enzyme [Roseospira marina]MBB5087701.1 glutathione synthase/RimK-type ligase-like ATP-grasp enzyme [Roseospira marina]